MSKIYLDYAATTPVDASVKEALLPYLGGPAHHASQRLSSAGWGNPGSLHSYGQKAIKAIDESRESVVSLIGADFREIVFTGSATEANNLALRGVIKKAVSEKQKAINRPKIIISSVEHDSILETAKDLEKDGVEVVIVSVDSSGVVNLEKLEKELDNRTVLVSVMYANNETGVIQPITKVANIIKYFRKNNSSLNHHYPLLHTDSVQAFQYLDCDVDALGVDLMTLSAHKIYGPKGIGFLYVRQSSPNSYNLSPVTTGGGQEFGLRSGTENVASIVGFAKALELADKNREKERKRMEELGSFFVEKMRDSLRSPTTTAQGVSGATPKSYPSQELLVHSEKVKKLPNIWNITFPGKSADEIMMALDEIGIAVSTGPACSSRSATTSHVLQAIGLSDKQIKSSIRFSFGKFTTKNNLKTTIKELKRIL